MAREKILTTFYDIKEKTSGKSAFFFLENILKARADLHLESGTHEFDQEINVYIAGLLNSLVQSDTFFQQRPYISPFDIDVRKWLAAHPGLRNVYRVYRENADFGLLFLGLFTGYEHEGSYHNTVMSGHDEQGRIALYYELAASALSHLQGKASLIDVFGALSENIEEIVRIIQYTACQYLDLMERISEGSFFHLERELDEMDERKRYGEKLDEFLKLYSAYKENPSDGVKECLMNLAEELRKLNENFRFEDLRKQQADR